MKLENSTSGGDRGGSRLLRIFLCHCRADKPEVRKIFRKLSMDGFEPWLDEKNLDPGMEWDSEIRNAIRRSDVVIVCLSKAAVTKEGYVQKEIRYALDIADEKPPGTKFLIPLRFTVCDVPDRLQRWHWVDHFEKGGYDRLVRSLAARSADLGIPVRRIGESVLRTPGGLAEKLEQSLIGQPGAVKQIASYLETFEAGLAPADRPAGVFLLVGPSGSGKTFTASAVAKALHGNSDKFFYVICSQVSFGTSKFTGVPPGYIGYGKTQALFDPEALAAIKSKQSRIAVLLFDEIEFATTEVINLLRAIVDRGIVELADSRIVNIASSLIFMTSNLRFSKPMQNSGKIEALPDYQGEVLSGMRNKFGPELANRIDCVLTYEPLSRDSLNIILDRELAHLQANLNTKLGAGRFDLEFSAHAREFIVGEGFDSSLGCRALLRSINDHLRGPIASLFSSGQIPPGCRVRVEYERPTRRLTFIRLG